MFLAKFYQLAADRYHWKPGDLSSIGQWLEQHPDAYVITDIKGRTIPRHQSIAETLPDKIAQFILGFTHKNIMNASVNKVFLG